MHLAPVGLDFETFYDPIYSVSKMGTQEYVCDPRFEVILITRKVGTNPTEWFTGTLEECRTWLQDQSWWNDKLLICHNTLFDGMILSKIFGLYPARYACTMSMMRAAGWHLYNGKSNLASLAQCLQRRGINIPDKGAEVAKNLGLRRADVIARGNIESYAAYGCLDTDICVAGYHTMAAELPPEELEWHDIALRMGIVPSLVLDREVLLREGETLRRIKEEQIDALAALIGGGSRQVLQSAINSGPQFLTALEWAGGMKPTQAFSTRQDGSLNEAQEEEYRQYVANWKAAPHSLDGAPFVIPYRWSTTRKEPAWAPSFSKSNDAFLALEEHDNPLIQTLVSTKLNASSTMAQGRIKRLLTLEPFGRLCVPLNIALTHTHRLSGADKINIQNLPSAKRNSAGAGIRYALCAPEGCVLIGCDSSQIEARVLAYAAGQRNLVEKFRNKEDPYSDIGAKIYGANAEVVKVVAKDKNHPEYMHYVVIRNCGKVVILSCGYQTGAEKLWSTGRTQHGLDWDYATAEKSVMTYRSDNRCIVMFWEKCQQVLFEMHQGKSGWFGGPNNDLFFYDGSRVVDGVKIPGIRLPDGMWINYRNLRLVMRERFGKMQPGFVYDRWKGFFSVTEHLYGGKVTENLIQALAFAILKAQARKISTRIPLTMNVHDEWVVTVPEHFKDEAQAWVEECMSWVPDYMGDCPIACESSVGYNYGEC